MERNGPNLVTHTTAIQLSIKRIILADIVNGVSKKDTFIKLKKVIETYSAKIEDVDTRRRFESSLAKSAVKLYSETRLRLNSIGEIFKLPLVVVISIVSGKVQQSSANPNTIICTERVQGGGSERYVIREFIFENRIDIPRIRTKLKSELSRLINQLTDEEIKDADGASLRVLAEMNTRYEAQQNSINQMRSDGVKLVWASTHIDCSPRCLPWQGKLYSLDSSYGITDTGIQYEPLENATQIPYTTKAGRTYMNGLLGFNCRHRLIPYKDEQVPPQGYSAEETRQHYAIDQRQRIMEREIRRLKEKAHLTRTFDSASASKMFAQAREMVKEYRAYCLKHNTVAMIYRTQVTVEEQQFNRKTNF